MDSRIVVNQYVVRPSCYGDLPEYERASFCLTVTDGHMWGWSVRMGPYALNRKGERILESRGSGSNKFRRWTLEEAFEIALKNVDKMKVNGRTAQEWVDLWAEKEE